MASVAAPASLGGPASPPALSPEPDAPRVLARDASPAGSASPSSSSDVDLALTTPRQELARRLRASEANAKALEEALAAKAPEVAAKEVFAGATERSRDRDAPSGHAHLSGVDWRARALDAERLVHRQRHELAALRSMLAERTPDETTDATRPSARQHAGLETAIRAAVAEGELASARARLRTTEEALGETRDRAASLEARLRTAERNLIRREDVEALVRRVEEAERAAAEVAARRVARRGGIEGRAEADERRAVENVAGATENLRSDGGGASSSALVVSPGSLAPVLAAKKSSARTSASIAGGSSETRAASEARGADAALAAALAAARRAAEAAERRAASGKAALERAKALERSAVRRLARGESGGEEADEGGPATERVSVRDGFWIYYFILFCLAFARVETPR